MEKWSNAPLNTPALQHSSTPMRANGFALYEVLIGVLIFSIGVIALGRAVENCMNASTLSAEEERVRQILSNRMAEIQTTPGIPDAKKESKVDTGYGVIQLIQKTEPAKLKEEDGTQLDRINVVTLTAKWTRGGAEQSRKIEFYVYRAG
jgi:Tfp pilus assembly protein PilV